MKVTDDIVLVAEIRAALHKNKELYGKQYCPCIPFDFYFTKDSQKYVCPCEDFYKNVEKGKTCRCGLYVK